MQLLSRLLSSDAQSIACNNLTSFLQFDAGTGVKLSDAFVAALYHVVFWTCTDY